MRPALAILLVGCGARAPGGAPAFVPDLACPGGPGCADVAGAPLLAGVAEASILPSCFESWVDKNGDATYVAADGDTFLDCGCDRLCPGDAGYPGPDQGEGDGIFQAAWIAGFGNGRAASGVRGASLGLRGAGDGMSGRALALRQGNSTLLLVTLDAVGWFNDDVLAVRKALADAHVDVDQVIVHSVHDHQAVDTIGIWGPSFGQSGYGAAWQAELQGKVVALAEQAVAQMQPVSLVVGEVRPSTYSPKGVANFLTDNRDPWVVQDELHAARLVGADGSTVATLVGWANHPESRANENTLISGDYVHALRETVESGDHWKAYSRDGVGGTCLFLNGAVGGMISPLHVTVDDPDGNHWSDASFEKADALGQLVGEMALDALKNGETVQNPRLSFRAKTFELPVENVAFQAMFLMGTVHRSLYDYDASQPIDPSNLPYVKTEIDVVDLGPIEMLTLPGELLPELAIGGYDGSQIHAPGYSVVDPNNENPPDLTKAPAGPYLEDKITGKYKWIVGLSNDEIGYIIPSYNFEVDPGAPYLVEAPGDHYEETNSLGPRTADVVDVVAGELLACHTQGS